MKAPAAGLVGLFAGSDAAEQAEEEQAEEEQAEEEQADEDDQLRLRGGGAAAMKAMKAMKAAPKKAAAMKVVKKAVAKKAMKAPAAALVGLFAGSDAAEQAE